MKVLVAMSGGVDSSVAAAVLREEGHDVTGVTLKLWGGASDSGCCSVSDVEDARRVAAQLELPHYVFNFAAEFDERVVMPYVVELCRGPDAESLHRVQPQHQVGPPLRTGSHHGLRRARHRSPRPPHDGTGRRARAAAGRRRRGRTSRTCSRCSAATQLSATLLPVGEMTKADVRAHAARLGLRTATKAESMDVCFITRGGRTAFLDARVPARPGRVVDTAGAELGAHDGVRAFTIGQRRGPLGRDRHAPLRGRRRRRDRDGHARRTADDLLRDGVALDRPLVHR